MSLWCGNCRQEIFNGFGMLYMLERFGGALVLPNKEEDYTPANSAVCDDCWAQVPNTERLCGETHKATLDKETDTVYLYLPSDSDRCAFGSKSWSSIESDLSNPIFLRHANVAQHLGKTLPIIEDMAQRHEGIAPLENNVFVKKVIAYLHTVTDSRVVAMREFAPGVIAVRDDYNNGELNVYFDPDLWEARNSSIWGASLTPPRLKGTGLSILEGMSSAPPPTNFYSLLNIAQQALLSRKGDDWNKQMIYIPTPQTLRPLRKKS